MTRAAIAFISGPAAKRILALRPNLLLKAASSTERFFVPPKVCAPAMKVNSDSFLAPAINESSVSAATTGQAAANRKNSVKKKPFMESPRLSRKYRVRVTSKQLFQVSCSCSYFPPEHEPRSRTRLVQQIFMGHKTDHLVLRRVSDHPQRI